MKRMKQKRPLKKQKQKTKQKIVIFRNCPLKGAQGDAVYILSALKVSFKENEAEEAAENSSSNCKPGYTYLIDYCGVWKVEFLS